VCRIRHFLGHVMSGSTLWVARGVCDCYPHARHDRGRVWAGHRPVAQQRVSPCKRVANTSGPMVDAGPRRERLRRRGAVVVSTQGGEMQASPWLRSLDNPDAGPATCARCGSVLSRTGTTGHVGAGDLCSRSGALRVFRGCGEIGIPEGVGLCQWGVRLGSRVMASLWPGGSCARTRAVPERGARLAAGHPGGAWPCRRRGTAHADRSGPVACSGVGGWVQRTVVLSN